MYVAYLQDAAWFEPGTRGTTAAVMILGTVGGCGMGRAAPDESVQSSVGDRVYRSIASMLGATALVAGIVGFIAGSSTALAVLFACTMALWLAATARHAVAAPPRPANETAGPKAPHGALR